MRRFVRNRSGWAATLGLLALIALLAACNIIDPAKPDDKTDPPPPPPPPGQNDYNSYSATLPSWSSFSPAVAPQNAPSGETVRFTETVDGRALVCAQRKFTIADNPRTLVTLNPNIDAFWVGSLLQGKHYKSGLGSLAELPIRQREAITIYVDVLGSDVTREVANPSPASTQQAIADMIIGLDASTVPLSNSLNYRQTASYSMEQAALQLGMSAKYLSTSVKASLSTSSRVDRSTLLVTLEQRLFTVSMVTPQEPGHFFTSEFTAEAIAEQERLGRIGPDNLPVYVSSIAYGRMLTFSFSSSASYSEIRGTLDASYKALGSGVNVNLSAEQRKILEEAEIKVVAIGGPQDSAFEAIRTGDYRAFFKENVPLSTAVPISYQVNNLANNTPAMFGETAEYTVTDCDPAFSASTQNYDTNFCETNQQDLFGNRYNCSVTRTETAPAGGYWDETNTRAIALRAGGNTYCTLAFSGHFVNENNQRVPSTVTVTGRAETNCGHCRANVQCRIEATLWAPTPPLGDPTPASVLVSVSR